MAKRTRHLSGTAGSKNVFNAMAREITRVPQPEVLRGFVLGLGAPTDAADEFEQRRLALVIDIQNARRRAEEDRSDRAPLARRRWPMRMGW